MSSESYWIERAGELSAALAEAQRERDEWQARHKDATARNAGLMSVIAEQRAELVAAQAVVEAVGVWANPDAVWAGDIRETPQDLALLTAWDTYEKTGGTDG